MDFCRVEVPLPKIGRRFAVEGDAKKVLSVFANAMGLELLERNDLSGVAEVVVGSSAPGGLVEITGDTPLPARFYSDRRTSGIVVVKEMTLNRAVTLCRLILGLGSSALILRGGCHCMLHGVLLQLPFNPDGIVLFGEPGAGKSSAAARFRSQGGIVLADDKVLLTFDGEGTLWAQPLPTWSSWNGRHKERNPANCTKAVRVKTLLHLVRGGDDEIVPADPVQWRLGLVRALNLHYQSVSCHMNFDFGREVAKNVSLFAGELGPKFRSLELRGGLKGRIAKHLSHQEKNKTQ